MKVTKKPSTLTFIPFDIILHIETKDDVEMLKSVFRRLFNIIYSYLCQE